MYILALQREKSDLVVVTWSLYSSLSRHTMPTNGNKQTNVLCFEQIDVAFAQTN